MSSPQASISLVGDAASYLSITGSTIITGTNDFTIQWWQFQTDYASHPRVFQVGTHPNEIIGVSIEYQQQTNTSNFIFWASGIQYATIANLQLSSYVNVWTNFAISYNSTQQLMRFFLNGTQFGSFSGTVNITNPNNYPLYIGNETTPTLLSAFGGNIYDFNWINGVSLYNSGASFRTSYSPLAVLPQTVLQLVGVYAPTVANLNTSWSALTDAPRNYVGVGCSANGKYVIAGVWASGTAEISRDYGQTWTDLSGSNISNYLSQAAISSDGENIAIASPWYNGQFSFSKDSGVTWNTYFMAGSTYVTSCNSFFISDSGEYWASIDSNGHIYTSYDSGTTWASTTITPSSGGGAITTLGLYGVSISTANGTVYVCGDSGIWKLSQNGTLQQLYINTTANTCFRSIDVSGDGAYIASSKGVGVNQFVSDYLYISGNGGTSFNQRANQETYTNVVMSSSGQYITAAVANSNKVYTSSNYGVTFTVSNPVNGLYAIAMADDAGETYVISPGQHVYRSVTSVSATFVNNGSVVNAPTIMNVGTTSSASVPHRVICFHESTELLCYNEETNTEEYRKISTISIGTLVKTSKSGWKRITDMDKTTILNPKHTLRTESRLYVYKKEKNPSLYKDLIVTGGHSKLANLSDLSSNQFDKLINFWKMMMPNGSYQKFLYVTEDQIRVPACIDEDAEPYTEDGAHTIYHIVLESDSELDNYGVYANGMLSETCSQSAMNEMKRIQVKSEVIEIVENHQISNSSLIEA